MIYYITVLRALAALLITNAHYIGVYPNDIIANGGLLGDVIFFAVSGFCLVNIKQNFLGWYKKRIIRIFPTVWIITTLYILLGFYTFEDWTVAEYFLYPTYYHFVASIIVLYIAYFVIMKNDILGNNIPKIMLVLFVIEMLLYLIVYDKSTYHIDNVREPFIRFLFFQSMLLGAYFRKNNGKYINKNKIMNWIIAVMLFALYFATKLAVIRYEELETYQVVNQVILILLLYYLLKCFAGIDNVLVALPDKLKSIFNFISIITLEIYLVQYVIIPRLNIFLFPINWIIITATIIISAYILHIISGEVIKGIEKVITVFSKQKEKKLNTNVTKNI